MAKKSKVDGFFSVIDSKNKKGNAYVSGNQYDKGMIGASDLKPCPFCGSTNVHEVSITAPEEFGDVTKGTVISGVVCLDCLGQIMKRDGYGGSDKAVALWNRRANNN